MPSAGEIDWAKDRPDKTKQKARLRDNARSEEVIASPWFRTEKGLKLEKTTR